MARNALDSLAILEWKKNRSQDLRSEVKRRGLFYLASYPVNLSGLYFV